MSSSSEEIHIASHVFSAKKESSCIKTTFLYLKNLQLQPQGRRRRKKEKVGKHAALEPDSPRHFFCDDARLDPPHLGFKTRIFFLRLGSASLCLPRGRRSNGRSNIFPPFPKSFFPRPFSELGQARHGWKFDKQILNSYIPITVLEILRSKNQWHFFCEVH